MVALASIHSIQKALWAYMQRGGRESSIKGQAGGQDEGLMALMALIAPTLMVKKVMSHHTSGLMDRSAILMAIKARELD